LITKIAWLDSVIAILFGSIIIYTGYKILKETTSNLMDEADTKILNEIAHILQSNKLKNWINIHNLKLVKYGDSYHIDCDLTLPFYMNIADAHKESEILMKTISENQHNKIDFTIHTDACHKGLCSHCKITNCMHRENPFENELIWSLEELTQTIHFEYKTN
jgi:divalent metal cation (Fe/Co/Zn/Cd) transporter